MRVSWTFSKTFKSIIPIFNETLLPNKKRKHYEICFIALHQIMCIIKSLPKNSDCFSLMLLLNIWTSITLNRKYFIVYSKFPIRAWLISEQNFRSFKSKKRTGSRLCRILHALTRKSIFRHTRIATVLLVRVCSVAIPARLLLEMVLEQLRDKKISWSESWD